MKKRTILLSIIIIFASCQNSTDSIELINAINNNDTERVISLIKDGHSVNTSQDKSWSPLMHAVGTDNLIIIEELLKAGADPNYQDENGTTALNYAAESPKRLETVKLLVKYNADINLKDNGGYTALTKTLIGKGYLPITEFLVKSGADLKSRDQNGETPLLWASNGDDIEIIKVLLDAGANPNDQDNNRHTALYKSIIYPEKFKTYAEKTLLDDKTHNYINKLKIKSYEITELLIKSGAEINVKNQRTSYLNIAVHLGSYEISEQLLEAGADPNYWNWDDGTALDLAIRYQNKKLQDLIRKYGGKTFEELDIDIPDDY